VHKAEQLATAGVLWQRPTTEFGFDRYAARISWDTNTAGVLRRLYAAGFGWNKNPKERQRNRADGFL
jgi:hypothetical protein